MNPDTPQEFADVLKEVYGYAIAPFGRELPTSPMTSHQLTTMVPTSSMTSSSISTFIRRGFKLMI